MNVAPPYWPLLQVLLTPIVRWCLRLGVGYGQFIRLLKPLFFRLAKEELTRQGNSHTGAALSFVSGLHKADITTFLACSDDDLDRQQLDVDRINPSNQVVARWVIEQMPSVIPLKGGGGSFDDLVNCVQDGKGAVWSTRLILQDLQRRKLVMEDGRHVRLLNEIGQPRVDHQNAVIEFVGAISDHINAGVANLTEELEQNFLEQSLVADELTLESVILLQSMSRQWWLQAVRELGAKAVECSNQDGPRGGKRRMRLGVYFYTSEMPPPFLE